MKLNIDKKEYFGTEEESKIFNNTCTPGEQKCWNKNLLQCKRDGSGWYDTGRTCNHSDNVIPSEKIRIDTPEGSYYIEHIDGASEVEVTCSGNACSKIRHRFVDYINRFDFKYEVKNISDKEIKCKLYWYDFLGQTPQTSSQVIWPGESYKFHPGANNRTLISVKSIKVTYK